MKDLYPILSSAAAKTRAWLQTDMGSGFWRIAAAIALLTLVVGFWLSDQNLLVSLLLSVGGFLVARGLFLRGLDKWRGLGWKRSLLGGLGLGAVGLVCLGMLYLFLGSTFLPSADGSSAQTNLILSALFPTASPQTAAQPLATASPSGAAPTVFSPPTAPPLGLPASPQPPTRTSAPPERSPTPTLTKPLPTSTAVPTQAPATPTAPPGERMYVCAVAANVRAGPGTDYPVVGGLVGDDPVTAYSRTGEWWHIGADEKGQSLYMHESVLCDRPGLVPAATATPAVGPAPSSAGLCVGYQVPPHLDRGIRVPDDRRIRGIIRPNKIRVYFDLADAEYYDPNEKGESVYFGCPAEAEREGFVVVHPKR